MRATIGVELKPFSVPNFVIDEKTGDAEQRSYKLSEMGAETLEAMCDEFRTSVFEKAGKDRPHKNTAG